MQFKLSNNQAKLSKQSITADAAIRIVFVNLARVYRYTHMIIRYRLCTRHHSRGADEDAHHNCYLIAYLVQQSRLPGLATTIVNPAGLPKWTQMMCAWCISRSRMSRSLTLLPGHKTYQNSELLRHLDIERDELVSREGSVSPMCGCTLYLGSPHKNSY